MKSKNFELVSCSKEYWEFVRNLRNDERVLKGFIEVKKISKKDQEKYMKKNSKFFRIALLNAKPVGYIGVLDNDIRVCTHPDYQNIGVGKFMVQSIKEIWPEAQAKIKLENLTSLKLFESCGYKKKYFLLERN